MFNKLLKSYLPANLYSDTASEAEEIRHKLEAIYQKINQHRQILCDDPKINFSVDDSKMHPSQAMQLTYYLAGYAIRYEFDDIQSIQIYRRGKVDSLQYAELLAISFENQVEFIADELFVKSDLYQLEILINHVAKMSQPLQLV